MSRRDLVPAAVVVALALTGVRSGDTRDQPDSPDRTPHRNPACDSSDGPQFRCWTDKEMTR